MYFSLSCLYYVFSQKADFIDFIYAVIQLDICPPISQIVHKTVHCPEDFKV
jgi:hypothetical protein